jgi:hypothetical protein
LHKPCVAGRFVLSLPMWQGRNRGKYQLLVIVNLSVTFLRPLYAL